ncbi:surface lipoprotein [Burkholderiales bacterium GJ-E10]|nr:surface lipoprotein [Burkholderiales bacterium GJ-E10]
MAIAATSLGAVLAVGGCATVPQDAGKNPADPYERFNRQVYAFNDVFDRYVGKPVAKGYTDVTPKPVRTCVGNIFSNFGEIATFVDTSLEGRPHDAAVSFGRLVLNTTFGLGGCLDLGPRFGLYRNKQDFGLTMGNWGVPAGPYIVLPLLGPSTVRDTVGMAPDLLLSPVSYVSPMRDEYALGVAYYVDRRAELLDATNLLEQIALDPYAFTRDGYLQMRTNLVYHGNPPRPKDDEEPEDPGSGGPQELQSH